MRSVVVHRLLLLAGVVGALLGLAVAVVGWWLVGALEQPLVDSLELTADSIEALDESLAVTGRTIAALDSGLDDAQGTVTELADALERGDRLLGETAELTETELADALAAVNRGAPAAQQAAGTVDAALRALALLPVGPDYDPQQPLADSVEELTDSLADVPRRLREQGGLLRRTGDSLGRAGNQADALGGQVETVSQELQEAARVVEEYADAATTARGVVADAQRDLRGRLAVGRALVVALGLGIALAQAAPITLGLSALRAERRELDRDAEAVS